jgi:hypothetical protein
VQFLVHGRVAAPTGVDKVDGDLGVSILPAVPVY